MNWSVLHADCRDVMANMGDNTVDSVVCDPPYHLTSIVKRFGPGCAPQQFGTDGAYARAARGFMGQTWDGGDIAFDPALWAEVLRVLKPGGHLLAFSGTRTYHRMAVAIEDAGFEVRDMLAWLYGSGFPKSHDFAAASKANGERVLMPEFEGHPQAEGRGTAIKPAHEPICVARKPLVGTVAANVLEWGVGGINIDGCRVGDDIVTQHGRRGDNFGFASAEPAGRSWVGRFPANVLHDGSDEVVTLFPTEAGAVAPVHKRGSDKFRRTYGAFAGNVDEGGSTFRGDQGSAARFFYCAKASKADREQGCELLCAEGDERGNPHPTVKPTDLMRWLCRLVTPPGGLVFDPFTGSGSTGKAAMLEGFRFLGAEMTAEYVPVALARIAWAEQQARG